MDVQEWLESLKGANPMVHGIVDMGTGESLWARVDTLGRVRQLDHYPYDTPRFRHPAYRFGYASAVAFEYRILLNDLFLRDDWPWHDEILQLNTGIYYPPAAESFLAYDGLVTYYTTVAEAVKSERPHLVEAVLPVVRRHGLDVLPWGLGFFLANLPQGLEDSETPAIIISEPLSPDLPEEWTPRAKDERQWADVDALLLYVWLTGAYLDERIRTAVKPLVDLEDGATLRVSSMIEKRMARAMKALGVHRPRGRPPGRSSYDREANISEHLVLVDSFVEYALAMR